MWRRLFVIFWLRRNCPATELQPNLVAVMRLKLFAERHHRSKHNRPTKPQSSEHFATRQFVHYRQGDGEKQSIWNANWKVITAVRPGRGKENRVVQFNGQTGDKQVRRSCFTTFASCPACVPRPLWKEKRSCSTYSCRLRNEPTAWLCGMGS